MLDYAVARESVKNGEANIEPRGISVLRIKQSISHWQFTRRLSARRLNFVNVLMCDLITRCVLVHLSHCFDCIFLAALMDQKSDGLVLKYEHEWKKTNDLTANWYVQVEYHPSIGLSQCFRILVIRHDFTQKEDREGGRLPDGLVRTHHRTE